MTSTIQENASSDTLTQAWQSPPGLWGWLTAVNHKQVGRRFIVTGLVFFAAGGVLALLMRTQLAVPENSFLSAEAYNQIFTMHGTTMMFFFAVPVLEGLAIYLMPLMLGSRDLPFPRLNAFGYYAYLFGGLFVFAGFLVGSGPSEGWFAYPPLSSGAFSPDRGMDFWLLGVTLAEVSGIVGGLELTVAFFRHRSAGMSLDRVPLFAWAAMVTGLMIVLAFPAIVTASTLLELERAAGMVFYEPSAGGDPLLWQHLFWFFGHPEVYIMLLPATGIVSMVVPVFSRRPIAGYGWVVAAVIAIGLASFGLWVHHMFTTGLPGTALAFFSAASILIAIPSGILVFSWLATMWGGRPMFRVPLLYVVGFLVTFVIGGVTGVMVASVPFDTQVHDSFFVVAHFHYVLLGGVVFPLFAGLYHWFPKWTGRLTSPKLGVAAFWTTFVGVNLAFFPQHFLGLQGMPRRVFTYQVGLGWELGNLLSTVGAGVIAVGVLTAFYDMALAVRRGPSSGDDPWQGGSLEWATSSPPPVYNFRRLPVVGSADPLWEGRHPTGAEVDRPDWIGSLAEPSEPVREVLETSPVEGEPEAVIRLPANSPWPVAAAVASTVGLIGVLGSWWWLAGAGAVAVAFSVVMWGAADAHLHHAAGRAQDEVHAETRPLRSTSSLWGLWVALASATVVLGSLGYGYWELANSADVWPPPSNSTVPIWRLVVVAGAAAATLLVIWLAGRAHDPERPTGATVLVAVAAAGSLATAALAGSVISAVGSITTSAYGSIVAALTGFVALLALLLALGLVSVAARLSAQSPAAGLSFRLAQVYSGYVLVAWLVVALVAGIGQATGGMS